MTARVALVYMAAQSSRAAVANRLERLSLLRIDYMSPPREEVVFVGAEDIGHFGPMFIHGFDGMSLVARTRSSEPSISSGLFVERTVLSVTCR